MNVDEITPERVREVLRFLARDRTPGGTPLSKLELVRRSLEEAGFQPTDQARQYEIGRLLTEIAEQELAALRRRAPAPAMDSGPLVTLLADFGHGCRELEAWSAVYHLYLRPDLDLRLTTLADWLDDRHRRTVQRRLRRGVAALAQRLQVLERNARLSERAARLAARVPVPTERPLVGAEGLVGRLRERLQAADGSPALGLRGPGGIGKTALAAALAQSVLAKGDFAELAWVSMNGWSNSRSNGSEPGEAMVGRIARQVVGDDNAAAGLLRARFRRRPTLLVLDGLDAPDQAEQALAALDLVGGPSRAVVTGRVGMSGLHDVAVQHVPALAPGAALDLLRREALERGLADVARAADNGLAPVVTATRGHPLAIRMAAAQLRACEVPEVAERVAAGSGVMGALCRDMWAATWARAGQGVRSVVRASARQAAAQDRDELGAAVGLAGEALTAVLAEAVDLGLLEADTSGHRRGYRPALFIRRFLLWAE